MQFPPKSAITEAGTAMVEETMSGTVDSHQLLYLGLGEERESVSTAPVTMRGKGAGLPRTRTFRDVCTNCCRIRPCGYAHGYINGTVTLLLSESSQDLEQGCSVERVRDRCGGLAPRAVELVHLVVGVTPDESRSRLCCCLVHAHSLPRDTLIADVLTKPQCSALLLVGRLLGWELSCRGSDSGELWCRGVGRTVPGSRRREVLAGPCLLLQLLLVLKHPWVWVCWDALFDREETLLGGLRGLRGWLEVMKWKRVGRWWDSDWCSLQIRHQRIQDWLQFPFHLRGDALPQLR